MSGVEGSSAVDTRAYETCAMDARAYETCAMDARAYAMNTTSVDTAVTTNKDASMDASVDTRSVSANTIRAVSSNCCHETQSHEEGGHCHVTNHTEKKRNLR
ncbi:uncharacterized protein LOC125025206 [Penaeus chinensis]|uniref:uncharacterized protein LOC125025206 n=1 Tax=Penaeus chinensis TaxID=139456 RepID=UPI001FB6A723|nr:uncharacterized protein LOC125025206 [Penaeus chinensis]